MNKQSLKVGSIATTECKSCLTETKIEDIHGRLCSNCIQTAGRFLHNTEYEDSLFQILCKDGHTKPKPN